MSSPNFKPLKILFLIKTNQEYGCEVPFSRAGLRNSAQFVVDAINKFPCVEAVIDFCKGWNEADNRIAKHRPDICIFEAVWMPPDKLKENIRLHPDVRFVTRVHSKIPFIAMEGNVIEWLREYEKVSVISFNSLQTSEDLGKVGLTNTYLPNIYPEVSYLPQHNIPKKHRYKVGCFGSIRPFKNQLNQAVAAILFAESRGSVVHFYVNATRVEQRGESVLKNMRALFAGGRHRLVEVDWLDHGDFLKLLGQMDASMQVSFTETFNIVSADSISQHVPIVVSDQIEWLSCAKAKPNDTEDIARQLAYVIDHRKDIVHDNLQDLEIYNAEAVRVWYRYLKR